MKIIRLLLFSFPLSIAKFSIAYVEQDAYFLWIHSTELCMKLQEEHIANLFVCAKQFILVNEIAFISVLFLCTRTFIAQTNRKKSKEMNKFIKICANRNWVNTKCKFEIRALSFSLMRVLINSFNEPILRICIACMIALK